ncbi:MAG: putative molybdenum carrier protein [Nostoc sp.]|uniref:YpsA SLOG family protein n=1 Tax=Nostoc sp. TaxID=1180 RepID=UPI002FFAF5D8
MNYRLQKIISGGQTGADRAGLDAAKALGISTGGTAPKGWRICLPDGSDGSDPSLLDFGLVEHESYNYRPRTIKNVADADATVWFGFEGSPGGKVTISTSRKLRKFLIVNPNAQELYRWTSNNQITTLNVAGNRLSDQNPDIYQLTYQTIIEAFS